MKRTLLALFVLLASAATAMAQSMKVFQDGQLKAIYYISKNDSVVFSEDFPFPPGGDVDPVNPDPDVKVPYSHAVDLGLPSGTKWADMNVGAENPEDYGWYLAWGETEGTKGWYDWSTYKWCNGSHDTQTKYCTNSSYGKVDNKTTLDPEDDAATVNWGGEWRTPTYAEFTELIDKCTWSWASQNGVKGMKVTGPNGNSIFLPASGELLDGNSYGIGWRGYYWCSLLYESDSLNAYFFAFASEEVRRGIFRRTYGQSVRPVCSE